MPEQHEQYDLVSLGVTGEIYGEHRGPGLLRVHPQSACAGRACCIHNPTGHHMRTWPMVWRGDRRIMERTCPHGVGHIDPDDAAYRRQRDSCPTRCDGDCDAGCHEWHQIRSRRSHDPAACPSQSYDPGVHGCDGCCAPPRPQNA